MSGYFPLFVDIKNAPIVVFGGGDEAYGKIQKLLGFSPKITVVASKINENIRYMEQIGAINVVENDPEDAEHLLKSIDPQLVFIADISEEAAHKIYSLCIDKRIYVNAVDRKQFCTFVFPSIVKRGELTVAVSTSGASPAIAKRIGNDIDKMLPSQADSILDWLAELRGTIRRQYNIDKSHISVLYRELANEAWDKNRPLNETETRDILNKYLK